MERSTFYSLVIAILISIFQSRRLTLASTCDSNPCVSNATCYGDSQQYACSCPQGYGGDFCQIGVNKTLPVRLVKGKQYSGNVEVYSGYRWTSVCHQNFGLSEASVVCRQLGYTNVSHYFCCSYYGYGSTSETEYLTDLSCNGQEDSLDQCSYNIANSTSCSYYTIASVVCLDGTCGLRPCLNGGSCVNNGTDFYCQCQGIWSGKKCEFVNGCRSNPCRNGATCINGPNGLEYNCTCLAGYTGSLCQTEIVAKSSIRLVGNNHYASGRIEIYYNHVWGTVCDDGFNKESANVACRQIGFPYAIAYGSHYGYGSGPIWLDDVVCTGNESALASCSHLGWGNHNCAHFEDVGVTCYDVRNVEVRITDGDQYSYGLVEVKYNDIWGTICQNGFTMVSANIICKQLGFLRGATTFYGGALYGQGNGTIWLANVNCTGNETNIASCPHSYWGINDCTHSEDISIVCNPDDLCTPNPCYNSGTCSVINGAARCNCTTDYGGELCKDSVESAVDITALNCTFQYGFCNWKHPSNSSALHWSRMQGQTSSFGTGPTADHTFGTSLGYYIYTEVSGASPGTKFIMESDAIFSNTPFCLIFWYNKNGATIGPLYVDDYSQRLFTAEYNKGNTWFLALIDLPPGLHRMKFIGVAGSSYTGDIAVDDISAVPGSCAEVPTVAMPTIPSPSYSEGQLRLVSGSSYASGRLEVYHDGVWGTVCDDGFGYVDALVVCRQLGFINAQNLGNHYQDGTGQIWLDDVQCSGTELFLTSCLHNGWGNHDCRHYEDIGVTCYDVSYAAVRLVNGNEHSYGRLEVYYNGTWGTVCQNGFTLESADTACRQLGFPNGAVSYNGSEYYDEGSAQIWLSNVACTGYESNIAACPHSYWGITQCTHSMDISVVCDDEGNPCTADPCKSHGNCTVQNGTYECNCDAPFFGRRCQHSKETATPSYTTVTPWATENSSTLYPTNSAATLAPSDGQIRFANGGYNYGRIEIYHNGIWGTVCDDSFTITDAKIVCRQMGFLSATNFGNTYGYGSGQIWLDDVTCYGYESSIADCNHNYWGSHNCIHSEDVGVTCSTVNYAEARLVDGNGYSYGRLEVKYNNTWGTVCQNGFTLQSAHIVCQQLGFENGAIAFVDGISYGPGNGPIWLSNVRCRNLTNSNANIAQCPHSHWGKTECTHNEDVGIICDFGNDPCSVNPCKNGGNCTSLNDAYSCDCLPTFTGNQCQNRQCMPNTCQNSGICSTFNSTNACSCPAYYAGTICQESPEDAVDISALRCDFQNDFCNWRHPKLTVSYPWIRQKGPTSTSSTGPSNDHTWGNSQGYYVYTEASNRNPGDKFILESPIIYSTSQFCLTFWYYRRGNSLGPLYINDYSYTRDTLTGNHINGWYERQINMYPGYHKFEFVGITGNGESSDIAIDDISAAIGRCVPTLEYQARLVAGPNYASGRVEVFYNRLWGTVCDDGFDSANARVICRQLGFLSATYYGNKYGSSSGQIWLDEVNCGGYETKLAQCSHNGWGSHNCNHNEDISVTCYDVTDVTIRLVNGDNFSYGRLEVFYDNTWGSVCQYGFDIQAADVACKQLGFANGAATFYTGAYYGLGSGQVWLGNVRCTGNESNIAKCKHSYWGQTPCVTSHYYDISVVCDQGDDYCSPNPCKFGGTCILLNDTHSCNCTTTYYGDRCQYRDLCLSNPCRNNGTCSMVNNITNCQCPTFYGGAFCEITPDNADDIDALNCDFQNDYCNWFHPVNSNSRSWSRNRGQTPSSNTGPSHDHTFENSQGYYIYTETSDGTFGQKYIIESQAINAKTSFCLTFWYNRNGATMGPLFVNDVNNTIYSLTSNSGNVWYKAYIDIPAGLHKFQLVGYHGGSFQGDMAIDDILARSGRCVIPITVEGDIRLVGYPSYYGKGRIEINHNGLWGTVCDDAFKITDADVACRQLGFLNAASYGNYGPGSGTIWLDEVNCSVNESSLANCHHQGWGVHDCWHSEDVGVNCSDVKYAAARLVNGNGYSNGRLEIYYQDSWGTVCQEGFTMFSANVVCRQLGFPNGAITFYRNAHYGRGNGTVWLSEVKCQGSELNLARCSHSYWGKTYCFHSEDVSVVCNPDNNECMRGIHSCDPNAVCHDTNTSYTCTCKSGFSGNGFTCQDINECAINNTNVCNQNAACFNSFGSYRCQCDPGFVGNGQICQDQNECQLGIAGCSIDATCFNTPGSFQCTCHQGFAGDGFTCKELRLYPYGASVSDQSFGGVDDTPFQIFLKTPIFFMNTFQRKIYISMNGFISFDRPYYGIPSKPLYTSRQAPIIAPFFADADGQFSATSRIFVSQYSTFNPTTKTAEIFKNATSDINQYQSFIAAHPSTSNNYGLYDTIVPDFNATSVTTITWYKLVPYPSAATSKFGITNTFQLVLSSDGNHLFASFLYEDKGMNWWKRYRLTNARVGYSNKFPMYTYELPNSNTKQLLRIDSTTGNYGKKGRWMYRVDDPSINHINYAQRCRTWFVNEPLPDVYLNELLRRPCPCSILQAIRDRRFRLNLNTFCMRSRFSRRVSSGERVYQRCCYSLAGKSFGSLITRYPFGSSFIFRNTTLQARNNEALTDCCMRSSLCSLYLKKRPINKCVGYKAPRKAWFWGDPHVRTFDGKLYTFNGLGEYVLLQTINKNFQLQGRTMKAIRNSSLSAAATVFSAFATMEIGADIVQFTLNSTFNGIDILVNRTISFNMDSLSENETREFNNVDVTRLSNITVAAIFTSGVSMEVTLLTQMLTIAFNGPDEIKGITSGLLGTWNDNINDDFKRPHGSYLNINSTESQIFYNFGQLWMINASDSLFTYSNGLSASNYSDPNFTPIFGQNIQALFANNTELYNQAVAQCGNNSECLFDAALTLNLDAAVVSKDTSQTYQDTSNQLENFPPQISGLTTYNVTYGNMFTTTLNITDPNNGDIVTVEIINPPINSYFDRQTYTFTWNISTYENISLTFVATDNKGARSELAPQIIMCYCSNNGTCDYAAEMVTVDNVDQVECRCNPAWTGNHCTQDFNACADQPCFSNATCTDNIAPMSGYTCSNCPIGYVGDGLKCSDYDECLNGTHACSQTCINEEGSYSCQCLPGYTLNSDNRGCTDVNECITGSNNCSNVATCTNQIGSYSCACNSGYVGDGINCYDVDECQNMSNNCSQICNNTVGSYTCSCIQGYELSSDKLTCVDINECQRFRPCDQVCINTEGSFTCECEQGFELNNNNLTCSVSDPCDFGHNCSQICAYINGSEICSCMKGYALTYGSQTECEDVDECSLNPSPCNQLCTNNDGSYTCSCMNGYRFGSDGWTCDDINECLENNPCSQNANCTNAPGLYSCQCKIGYTGNGKICNDIDECLTGSNMCSSNASCMNNNGSYSCMCKPGFIGNGYTCQDVNECSTMFNCNTNEINNCTSGLRRCSVNAACSNSIGSYTCGCNSGYSGDGFTCQDIDECNATSLNMCVNNSQCINTNGSYQCKCNAGYFGNARINCSDVDECSSNQYNCHSNAHCTNIPGSFTCHCKPGYYGNGVTCAAVVTCDGNNNCTNRATCMIFENKYYCSCKLGYYSNNTLSQIQLQSDSHCQQGKVFFGSLKIGGTFTSDLNNSNSAIFQTLKQQITSVLTLALESSSVTKDGFERVEVTGFKAGSIIAEYYPIFKQNSNINPNQIASIISTGSVTIQGQPIQNVTVTDFNECARSTDNICNSNQNCINLPGTYNCQCKVGFTGSSCVDINECLAAESCGINAVCRNTLGSYTCTCLIGYQGNPYSNPGCSIECNDDFCLNGGKCIYQNNTRTCNCTDAYTGIRCSNLKATGLSIGAVAGISVGTVSAVFLIAIAGLVYYLRSPYYKRRTSVAHGVVKDHTEHQSLADSSSDKVELKDHSPKIAFIKSIAQDQNRNNQTSSSPTVRVQIEVNEQTSIEPRNTIPESQNSLIAETDVSNSESKFEEKPSRPILASIQNPTITNTPLPKLPDFKNSTYSER